MAKSDGQFLVTVTLNRKAQLKQDSQAYIEMYGFMGEKYVELTPGTEASPVLEPGQTIRGEDPLAMHEIFAKGTLIAEEFQKTASAFTELVENVNQTLDENSPLFKDLMLNIDGAVNENRSDLKAILENINFTTADMKIISSNVKELTDDLKKHPWKLLRKTNADKNSKKFLFF